MEVDYKIIKDTEGFEAFRALLNASGLPVDDLDFNKDLLVGYYEGEDLVGTGGLEIYGPYALLRSLSVKMGIRGKAVGSTITEYLLAEAKGRGLKSIYLLTETARGFFLKKGFADVERDEVPEEIKQSGEYSKHCSKSAAVMRLSLS